MEHPPQPASQGPASSSCSPGLDRTKPGQPKAQAVPQHCPCQRLQHVLTRVLLLRPEQRPGGAPHQAQQGEQVEDRLPAKPARAKQRLGGRGDMEGMRAAACWRPLHGWRARPPGCAPCSASAAAPGSNRRGHSQGQSRQQGAPVDQGAAQQQAHGGANIQAAKHCGHCPRALVPAARGGGGCNRGSGAVPCMPCALPLWLLSRTRHAQQSAQLPPSHRHAAAHAKVLASRQ